MNKLILFTLISFTFGAHANFDWTPYFQCSGGSFEIDRASDGGRDMMEEQAVIRDPQAIQQLQTLVGKELILENGALVIASTGDFMNAQVDAWLANRHTDSEHDLEFEVHGRPIGGNYQLKLNVLTCTTASCSPNPGTELGSVQFAGCQKL